METVWDLLSYPRLCGVLARKPTRLGQAMHNAGYRELSLPFTYVAFDTEDTAHSLEAMRRLGIRGFSLTIPHKEQAVPLMDHLSAEAAAIGAVNTVVNSGLALSGENTDWIGVREALSEASVDIAGKDVLVFGAGGASRSALFTLKRGGARRIVICNRTKPRAEELAKLFGAEPAALEDLPTILKEKFALIVNTTPLGSHLAPGENPLQRVYEDRGPGLPAFFEMVTKETPLLLKARDRGATVIPGSRMLLFQALEQFRLYTEQPPPRQAMERALQDELRK